MSESRLQIQCKVEDAKLGCIFHRLLAHQKFELEYPLNLVYVQLIFFVIS